MLKAGADPDEVWGTGVSGGPRQSAWQRFFSAGGTRQAGYGSDSPIHVALRTDPDVVRALVAAIEVRNVALMTYLEEHGARERP